MIFELLARREADIFTHITLFSRVFRGYFDTDDRWPYTCFIASAYFVIRYISHFSIYIITFRWHRYTTISPARLHVLPASLPIYYLLLAHVNTGQPF